MYGLGFGETAGGFGQIKVVVTCLQREPELSKNTASLLTEPLRKETRTLAGLQNELRDQRTSNRGDHKERYACSLIGIVQGGSSEESFLSLGVFLGVVLTRIRVFS